MSGLHSFNLLLIPVVDFGQQLTTAETPFLSSEFSEVQKNESFSNKTQILINNIRHFPHICRKSIRSEPAKTAAITVNAVGATAATVIAVPSSGYYYHPD